MRRPQDSQARFALGLVVGCAVMAAGCGPSADIRRGDIRTYSVPRQPAPVAARPAPGAVRPDSGAPAPTRLRYEVPDGWVDRGGSGMRLATLAIGDPADGHEVTLVEASGTPRANVDRWQGQLDSGADESARGAAVDRALAAAETLDVDGVRATVVALFDEAAAAGPDADGRAILAAIVPLDDVRSLFVKFTGPAAVARRERPAFVRFVSSLRWK